MFTISQNSKIMRKVKIKSVNVIKKASLWISSSAVIFILILLLLYACNQNQYSSSQGENKQDSPVTDPDLYLYHQL